MAPLDDEYCGFAPITKTLPTLQQSLCNVVIASGDDASVNNVFLTDDSALVLMNGMSAHDCLRFLHDACDALVQLLIAGVRVPRGEFFIVVLQHKLTGRTGVSLTGFSEDTAGILVTSGEVLRKGVVVHEPRQLFCPPDGVISPCGKLCVAVGERHACKPLCWLERLLESDFVYDCGVDAERVTVAHELIAQFDVRIWHVTSGGFVVYHGFASFAIYHEVNNPFVVNSKIIFLRLM